MIRLVLEYPPTANLAWRKSRKGMYLDPKHEGFRLSVAAEVSKLRRRAIRAPVEVAIVLTPPDKRRRDIDNPIKPLLDALTHAGAWIDDEQVKRLWVDIMPDQKPGRVEVIIKEIEWPTFREQ